MIHTHLNQHAPFVDMLSFKVSMPPFMHLSTPLGISIHTTTSFDASCAILNFAKSPHTCDSLDTPFRPSPLASV